MHRKELGASTSVMNEERGEGEERGNALLQDETTSSIIKG
jgi:hypothetical protein